MGQVKHTCHARLLNWAGHEFITACLDILILIYKHLVSCFERTPLPITVRQGRRHLHV